MTVIIKELKEFGTALENQFELIPTERKKILNKLSAYILYKFNKKEIPKLIVICTHNSRRSHIGELLLAFGVHYYQLPNIQTYSGGTETSAFNPRAVKAIESIGFWVQTQSKEGTNPLYEISWLTESKFYLSFSKKYDDPSNPRKDFAAIMVCSEADRDCPTVWGADFRLALPYKDPKVFDDTDLEEEKYRDKCYEIGREMFYVLQQVKRSLDLGI